MRPARPSEPNPPVAVSLRAGFAWTFAGNATYAAGQWVILSLTAKFGGREMLGQYALAVAVTAPVVMLSHLNLRAVLATDIQGLNPLGDYVAVRLGASGLGLAAIGVVALIAGGPAPMAAAILLAGIAQSIENVSDIYFGAMQRRDEMERIARSMIARALVASAGFGAVLWMTRSLLWSLAAMIAGRVAVLTAYDWPRGAAGERRSRSGWRAEFSILRTALPLGLVLMLVSLNANLPRYAVERYLGGRELAAFAAVVSFATAGSTVVNALGQAATPRLTRYFSGRELGRFRHLTFRLAGLAVVFAALGTLAAALAGRVVLEIAYRPEYAAYSGLLLFAMSAAVLSYLAIVLGYALTSARAFNAQAPLFISAAAACGLASWLLVPRFGLAGAVLALAAAACVQIAGGVLILTCALRRAEAAS